MPRHDNTMGRSEIYAIRETLKELIKGSGISYGEVGKSLGVSVPTVKRWLGGSTPLSLDQIYDLCSLLGLSISDVVEMARAKGEQSGASLSMLHEQTLAEDPQLALVRLLVANGWSAREIIQAYGCDEALLTGLLIRLEKMGILTLLPNNHVIYRGRRRIDWVKGGPMETIINIAAAMEMEAYDPGDPDQHRFMEAAELSEASIAEVLLALQGVLRNLDYLAEKDRMLPRSLKRWFSLTALLKPTAWTKLFQGKNFPDPGSRTDGRRKSA